MSARLRKLIRALRRRSFLLSAEPLRDLAPLGGGRYRATGVDAALSLRAPELPSGWVELDFALSIDDPAGLPPLLLFDSGSGYRQSETVRLPKPRSGRVQALVRLPPRVLGLRLHPVSRAVDFTLGRLRLRQIGALEAGARLSAPLAAGMLVHPGRLAPAATKAARLYRRGGIPALRHGLIDKAQGDSATHSYAEWHHRYAALREEDVRAIEARVAAMPRRPLISVLMPTWETPERWLRAAIQSVRAQHYPEWELCIADDASAAPHVRRVLEEAARAEPRIKLALRQARGHISAASNDALALASGELVALLDHDDELTPDALYQLAAALVEEPKLDLLYSDEDKIDQAGALYEPHFKPEWNPELLSSQMYVGHLAAYRTSLVRELGGFRQGFEGSQDHDLCLRVSARTSPARIRHLPFVLYHWRSIPGSTASEGGNKGYAGAAGLRAVQDFHGPSATVAAGLTPGTYRVRLPLPSPSPLVSIIIPTRDGYQILERAIRSVLEKTSYAPFEILVVDNQSRDPRTLAYLEGLAAAGTIRLLRWDAPFNYSAINNHAVREARGEIVCLLNNDVEVISPDWLGELVSYAVRPGVGAVGAKLLYPDGTIQHGGVLLGLHGVAGHVFRLLERNQAGYFGRPQVAQAIGAVTGACLAVRRQVFLDAGGLDEDRLKVAFNDVDFCLKLLRAGLRNVYTPWAELYHHESATRGYEDTPEKQARFRGEIEAMLQRWGEALLRDPAHNPNLSLQSFNLELAFPPRVDKRMGPAKAP